MAAVLQRVLTLRHITQSRERVLLNHLTAQNNHQLRPQKQNHVKPVLAAAPERVGVEVKARVTKERRDGGVEDEEQHKEEVGEADPERLQPLPVADVERKPVDDDRENAAID